MRVLIIGSGGREHALAWKVRQSPRLKKLWIAPGNAGTAALGENLPLPAEDAPALAAFARQNGVDLVIIGPEAPLAAGLADALRAAGLRVFGPSGAAAQIEASKAFAKQFMARHNIPTARFALFDDYQAACAHLRQADYPVVIKASGLAAGKGVILPERQAQAEQALRAILLEGAFGAAGAQVVIEERLSGPEVSLMAFTDGHVLRPMPPAQDHKRLLDGDAGPNTGGMGAYAPAEVVCPPALARQIVAEVLQPAVNGLRLEGMPFVGVLYAGMMLTPQGPRLLEFNCRFGDPETQAVLPLLDSDLLHVMDACIDGRLAEMDVRWKAEAAACVVLASAGYPGKTAAGVPISGLDAPLEDAVIFHAGTKLLDGQVLSAGGRVLGVTGLGADLRQALDRAYAAVTQVHFEGAQYRRDIGAAGLAAAASTAYAAAGVSIDAGNRAVNLMRQAVQSTYGPQVLAGIGAFGGLYDAAELQTMRAPVLVASTDGVGTKVKLAAQAGRYASVGQDIVNHCVDDILVQGARPLFFLDYFATSRLQPEVVAEIVGGMAAACRDAGCALLGGETAEMPGVYAAGEFDVAGTIVGLVERERVLPRSDLAAGDLLIGLASSGPHTNGYSLIRRVFADVPLETVFPELGIPLGEALLAPHRAYLRPLWPLLNGPDRPLVKALAHLTGGGFIENIPRVLPPGLRAEIRADAWPVPPLFRLIQQRGGIDAQEMYRVFNMGIGMLLVVNAQDAAAVRAAIPEQTWEIGWLSARSDDGARVVLHGVP